MFKNRLFNLSIAVALILIIVLTVREAAAAAEVISRRDSAKAFECASLPSRYSIHMEYVKELGMFISYTEDGRTGIDGGLLDLLSNYRTCSR